MTPYEKLKQICSQKTSLQKLLIQCPDNVRRQRSVEFALKSLAPEGQSFSVQKVEASSLTIDSLRDLRDSSLTLSLFSSQKIIVIKNIDKTPTNCAKEIEKIFANTNSSNIFICTAASTKAVLSKIFDKTNCVEFPALEGVELIKWVNQELKRNGCKEPTSKVAQTICSMCSDNLDSIASLIEKLALHTDNNEINMNDLEALDTFKEKVQEFYFVNLLTQGKRRECLLYVQQLKASGTSAFPLLGLLSKMFSNYLRITLAKKAGRSDSEIMKELGLAPWALKKQSDSIKGLNEIKLLRTIKAITRADSQLKNKNLGEDAILTELVGNACS